MTREIAGERPQGDAAKLTPRDVAYEVLCGDIDQKGYAAQALDERLVVSGTRALRGAATELVYGVIRRRATLDAILRRHMNRPPGQVEAGALSLLRLGTYQLVWHLTTPAYAIVNETVAQAARLGETRWKGFVNGVLRAVARGLTSEVVDFPGARGVPLDGGAYRLLRDDLFADPQADALGYFVEAFSFPRWLSERWWQRQIARGLAGSPRDEMFRLGFWFNAPPAMCLRANSLRTTRDGLLAEFAQAGIAARPGQHPDSIWLDRSFAVSDLPGFNEGRLTVQDESAMEAVSLLSPRPGERVLDLCAAPGGKTAHLAAAMTDTGTIVAADVDAARLALVDQTCQRLGVKCVETALVGRDGRDLPNDPFDAILVDAPCSNTGVLGKRPEVRWRLRPTDIDELARLQTRLLREALKRLRPGGRLVYSTCSIEPEENERVVEAVLSSTTGMALGGFRHHIPGKPADGAVQALLVRRE
jgi:16S rRNA (cytosine967-C5)-methyltransferase